MKHLFLKTLLILSFSKECCFGASYSEIPPKTLNESSTESTIEKENKINDVVTIYPISDLKEIKLPHNLRLPSSISTQKPLLNIEGLNHLKISGSAQFSEETFKQMIYSLPYPIEKLVVIDLREESHGFINGTPISWTDGKNNANTGKTKEEIELDERKRLEQALQEQHIVIDPNGKPYTLPVQIIKTEQELVEGYGASYIRLPVTDRQRPSDATVDQLLALVKNTSPDRWLYFHCRGGKGRATTFLTLLDIIENASRISLEDILFRQYLIGGSDLTQTEKQGKKDLQRVIYATERLEFIKQFYLYCQETPDFHRNWSEWVREK